MNFMNRIPQCISISKKKTSIISIILYLLYIIISLSWGTIYLSEEVDHYVPLILFCLFGTGLILFFRIKIDITHSSLLAHLCMIGISCLTVVMVEHMHENELPVFSFIFFMNMIIVMFLIYLFLTIFRYFSISSFLAFVICLIIGIVNHYLLLFKGTAFKAYDILAIQTAASVASEFEFEIDANLYVGIVMAVFLITACIQFGKVKVNKKEIKYCTAFLAGAFVWISVFLFQGTGAHFADDPYSSAIEGNYNGQLANFAKSLPSMLPSKPNSYNSDIDRLLSETSSYKKAELKNTKEAPNIIVIMNESFTDLSVLGDMEYENPIPYITKMMKKSDVISGYLDVEVIGGGTANTEYEFLTSNTPSLLQKDSYPLQQYCQSNKNSIAWLLKQQGYKTTAFHPFFRSSWGRKTAYPNLGFDSFLSIESYYDVPENKKRTYISDESNYDRILEVLHEDKNTPQFAFNVTIQNHGGYKQGYINMDKMISINKNISQKEEVEEFINVLRESDLAFQHLIERLKNEKKPTIVLMFGDHQPPLNDYIESKTEGMSADEKEVRTHMVPFLMWANYGIKGYDAGLISPKYLAPMLIDTIGLQTSDYYDFLLELKDYVPVLNRRISLNNDYDIIDMEAEDEYTSLIQKYLILEYKNAFKEDSLASEYFTVTKSDKK